jgi:hypothetical protein
VAGVFRSFRPDDSRDFEHWLRNCEGFHALTPTGVVSVAQGVRFGSRHDRPDVILVRGGLFGRGARELPVDQIEEIRPRERQIFVGSSAS